eukprot:m.123694 g.123694  ORF g.123694 m.123694 type:complete len:52 (-) comp16262_c0_seq1:1768-1923(-)
MCVRGGPITTHACVCLPRFEGSVQLDAKLLLDAELQVLLENLFECRGFLAE